ncbi:MAG: hypothetical protein PHT76_15825 [Anaerostipes sp.]|nr:hypothetical protein [Anaerostipes sp.]
MISFMLVLIIISVVLWIGFELTGALLAALFWVGIKLPLALILWSIGIVCCLTLLLIPVEIWMFKAGARCLV